MALDTIAGVISSIVGSVLVARVMGPTALGYYNYVLWIAGITGQIGAFGVPLATRKFAAELRGRGDLAGAHAVVSSSFKFQTATAAAICLIGGLIILFTSTREHRIYSFLALLS